MNQAIEGRRRKSSSPSQVSLRALDALNVFLADVRDGLGPYLAVYLAAHNWEQGRVGIAMAAMGVSTVVAQTPAGAFIDRTRHKRMAIVIAAVLVAIGTVAMATRTTFPVIVGAQVLTGAAAAIFPPAIAALSLGMVGHDRLASRTGRNEAFNHSGNVVAAVLAWLIGDYVAFEGIFYLLAAMALAASVATLMIRPGDVDDDLARGGEDDADADGAELQVSRLGTLFSDRRVLVFIGSITLFHLANAAMLPWAGMKVAGDDAQGMAGAMSACIIAAQLVMVPVAVLAGRLAETWGRRAVFLVGFAVLPIRGVLYTMTSDPRGLVAVQLLDGIGAGIFGVVGVLVIADLTRGTGRFNLMQGALATATGLGSALSNVITGYVVTSFGFNAGFLVLAGIAASALAFFGLAMPETRPGHATATPAPMPAEVS
ncbi:MFS transporter [Isosphaeraceae bacterium EP7]